MGLFSLLGIGGTKKKDYGRLQIEHVSGRRDKNSEDGQEKKKKSKGNSTVQQEGDVCLYILMERQKKSIVKYLNSYGIHVKYISDDIDELSMELMMEMDKWRLLIVEVGDGHFIETNYREEIVNILGIGSGTENCITVIYINSELKGELKKRTTVPIDFIKSHSMSQDIVDVCSIYNKENYVEDGGEDIEEDIDIEYTAEEELDYGSEQAEYTDIWSLIDVALEKENPIVAYPVKL